MMGISLSTVIVLLLCAQISTTPPTAERTLPERGYLAGAWLNVSIVVSGTTSDVTLIEILPEGWIASNLNNSGVFANSQIKYILRKFPKPRTITYVVTPPESANGEQTFSGYIEGNETGGMTTIGPMIPEPIGIFENHIDLGIVAYNKTEYDNLTDEYKIEVGISPQTILGHLAYKKVTGDCSIQARVKAQNDNPNAGFYSLAALGLYDNLSNSALWFGIETKANGECWYGFGKGIGLLDDGRRSAWPPFFDGRMRIERHGDVMSASYFDTEYREWTKIIEHTMHFEDPVYIGIQSSCSQGQYNIGTFSDVELTYDAPTPIGNWELF